MSNRSIWFSIFDPVMNSANVVANPENTVFCHFEAQKRNKDASEVVNDQLIPFYTFYVGKLLLLLINVSYKWR